MTDLWPDSFGEIPETRGPISILKTQARMLEKKTDGTVEAIVKNLTSQKARLWSREDYQSYDFVFAFDLLVRSLKNYRYRLLTVLCYLDLYPVDIDLPEDFLDENEIMPLQAKGISTESQGRRIQLDSEESLQEVLKVIFASKKMREIVFSLMQQAKDKGDAL